MLNKVRLEKLSVGRQTCCQKLEFHDTSAGELTQVFLQRLPIVCFPPDCQVFRCPIREACMIKTQFGSGTLLRELELNNRVDPWRPANLAPSLDQSLVGCHLDMS